MRAIVGAKYMRGRERSRNGGDGQSTTKADRPGHITTGSTSRNCRNMSAGMTLSTWRKLWNRRASPACSHSQLLTSSHHSSICSFRATSVMASPPRPSSTAHLYLLGARVEPPGAGLPRRRGDGALPALQGPVPSRHRPRAVVTQGLQAAEGLFFVRGAAHRAGRDGARQEQQQDQHPPPTPHRVPPP